MSDSSRDLDQEVEVGDVAAGAGRNGHVTLDELSRATLELADRISGPLRSLRLRSGEASIEVEWPSAAVVEAAAVPLAAGTPDVAAGVRATQASAGAGGEAAADRFFVCSPMVGTFYQAPEPGAQPFVSVGDTVTADQQVGIIEAMKLMNRVDAGRDGRVVEVLVQDGTPVEYGEQLVACEPLEG